MKPELEVFDVGMILTCLRMRDLGYLEGLLHLQFVLGTPRGSPATPKLCLHMFELATSNAYFVERIIRIVRERRKRSNGYRQNQI